MEFYKFLPLHFVLTLVCSLRNPSAFDMTSLVSPLLWDKSKYGAVPSAKCSLQFLFLPKRGHEEPRPGCLHQIAELGLPLIFRRERSEFRVQQTLQHVQSVTPDDFSKQWFVESLIFQSK